MEAIGTASAIIGVAQFGLQFSQVLITVIGDYRDAAKNINRLRDEIHLASIALQQLGDLASRDLLRQYGILEATNLRERTQAVFVEIRRTIRKEYTPLEPKEVSKEEIDVTRFTSFRWALWTKKQLEEPRQELDRLKSSMTLCFVSHMALLAGSDLERARYASQIPGIKRSLAWSERKPDNDYLRDRLLALGISQAKVSKLLNDDDFSSDEEIVVVPDPQPMPGATTDTVTPTEPLDEVLKAWSIDPLATTKEMPVSQAWLQKYITQHDMGDQRILTIHSKLHPWFKNELKRVIDEQSTNTSYNWTLVLIEPFFKNFVKHGYPKSIHVVLRGSSRSKPPSVPANLPATATYKRYNVHEPVAVPASEAAPSSPSHVDYSTELQQEYISIEPKLLADKETDEQIIAKQLALYQRDVGVSNVTP